MVVGVQPNFISKNLSIKRRNRYFVSKAGGSRWCKLLIWDNRKYLETRLTLSETAASEKIATYVHNPSTKFEILIIRGEEFQWVNAAIDNEMLSC